MKLKRIELQGFKSFYNKTEFVFDAGVTAIVGPNGCGKSNIVDSINWVLGTLSSKLIRSDEMLDVIAKGTESLPPMAFAQVSLTIDNADHLIPVAFEEITVTRKIYRSGECEYFINKSLCRLKDIKEMFYNTGLGADNYGIIEQGKIENLIMSSPKERRWLFDEVAGISKYKAKRKEAILKLEKVNADLLRLQDLLKEVESQLHSIRIQAGRAKKYVEIQDELKAKRSIHLCHEYKGFLTEIAGANAAVEALRERRRELDSRRDACSAQATDRNSKLSAVLARINELNLKISETNQQSGHVQESIGKAEEFLKDLETQKLDRAKEKLELQRKAQAIEEQVAQKAGDVEKLQKRVEEIEAQIREANSQLEEAAFECQNVTDQMEEKKTQSFELARKESNYRTELTQIETSIQILTNDLEKINKTLEKIQPELAGIQTKLREKETEKTSAAGTIQQTLERKNVLEADKQKYEEELKTVEAGLDAFRKERDTKIARRDTLQELENKMAGLDAGSKALLHAHEGVLGIVADYIEIETKYLAVADVILQDLPAHVVAKDLPAAFDALMYVKSKELGSVGIVALTGGSDAPEAHPEQKTGGVLGRATDFIEIKDPTLARALAPHLGRYWIVDTMENAIALIREGTMKDPLVTLDGTLFEHNVIKMKRSAHFEQNVLSRRVVLRELAHEIKAAVDEIVQKEKRREQLQANLQYVNTELETARHSVYEKQVEMRELSESIESLTKQEALLKKEAETLDVERTQLRSQMESSGQRQASLAELLKELTAASQKLAEELELLTRTQKQYEKSKERLQSRLKDLQVGEAHVKKSYETVRVEVDRLTASIEETRQAAAKADGYVKQVEEKMVSLRHEIENSHSKIQELAAVLQELQTEAGGIGETRSAIEKECEAASQELQAIEKELESFNEEAHKLELKASEVRLNLEHLEQRAQEEIAVDLRAASATYVEDPDTDYAALAEEVAKLKRRLASFGAVNMLALEKLQELETRNTFLGQQQTDLENSKRELDEFIQKVNLESTEQFKKTMEIVRAHFNDIFRKIFGGGKADLVVESEADVEPLEQGIEVMAKLPKKEVTKLSLMSGGEKSLTAIALTLAMFRTRPTAFCILDEVDAALDESNVGKFASIVREFSKETQFIVITHNKRTMMVSDKMYGITMSPPGVSKRVSVNFENAEQKAEAPAEAKPETPA